MNGSPLLPCTTSHPKALAECASASFYRPFSCGLCGENDVYLIAGAPEGCSSMHLMDLCARPPHPRGRRPGQRVCEGQQPSLNIRDNDCLVWG